jgi:hypothetical protein
LISHDEITSTVKGPACRICFQQLYRTIIVILPIDGAKKSTLNNNIRYRPPHSLTDLASTVYKKRKISKDEGKD